MFVRHCYSELRDTLFELFHDSTENCVVLTGSQGIGKSMFVLFLLYNLRLEGKTVVLDFKNKWYRFSDDKGVERGNKYVFSDHGYLNDPKSWFLCDPSSYPLESFA